MDIRGYVSEKYTLHPFLMELFDHERGMWQYYALKALEKDQCISSLEDAVKRNYSPYEFLASYFDGPREQFKFKEGDKETLFKEIALDMKARSKDEFSRLNKPVPPPEASGYKLLDMLNLHVCTGQELDDETIEKCVLMYLNSDASTYNLLSTVLPIPPLQTIERKLEELKNGGMDQIRTSELKEYLIKNN